MLEAPVTRPLSSPKTSSEGRGRGVGEEAGGFPDGISHYTPQAATWATRLLETHLRHWLQRLELLAVASCCAAL